jgi:DMSO/TMAO reductase YedYZ molybdopterin-dependent catalytic subunit
MSAQRLKVVGDSGQFHRLAPLDTREDWRLKVWQGPQGKGRLLGDFSMTALGELQTVALPLEIECVSAGYIAGKGTSVPFGGIHFSKLIEMVYPDGIPEDLRTVKFVSRAPGACGPKSEKHWTSLPIDVCLQAENGVALAWSLDGAPLPYQHGGPLRGVVGSRLFFYKAVKWLEAIELVTTPLDECRGTWEEYGGYNNQGWSDGKRFEPRMRVIDRVVAEDGISWDESTLVDPENWGATINSMLKERNFSRLIVARLHEMGLILPKDYSDFKFFDGDFHAKLRGTRFSSCRFHGAQLAGCNFSLSYFTNAEFSRNGEDPADLENCDFEGASFQKAWLQNVSMAGAMLTNVAFTKDPEKDPPSERVIDLDVRKAIKLDERTREWLRRGGARVR